MSPRYDQYCPVARALELVGERWTLLIARELLLGPRRFTDLMAGIPRISSNVLAARLKELEHAGMVSRRSLPPPAASTVYELNPDEWGLAGVLAAMAQWGMTLLGRPRRTDAIRGRWLVLGLAVTATVSAADDTTYELRIDDDTLELRVRAGKIQPRQGPADAPDAVITMEATTLAELTDGELEIAQALTNELVVIDGDEAAGRRLLEAFRARAVKSAAAAGSASE
jgi:DNA-binding HxlR family transcriptional regulator/putative sterol carrier protein